MRLRPFLALAMLPALSGCLWLNTLFNERKAWEMAESSRERRLRKNPLDTVAVSPEERALYERTIVKGSKILELWPKDSSWHPEALILIGHAQQRLSQHDAACRTYLEIYERHPASKRWMGAIQGEVECLLALGRHTEAADWMKRLDSARIEGGAASLAWLRAQLALGRFDTLAARAELSRLLAIRDAPVARKAQAAWLGGNLAWAQSDWTPAREFFLREEILHLPYVQRSTARIRAALALDRQGKPKEAIAALRNLLAHDFQRSESEILVEIGRIELANGWYSEAIVDLMALERMLVPPDKVAEGMVLLGDDARIRRIDDREALRVYLIGSRTGGSTFWGLRAKALADALSSLARLREQNLTDSTRFSWNFSLAELYLLQLDNKDSARAAYNRVLTDTAAPRTEKARASYALAWIADQDSSTARQGLSSPWLGVVSSYPGTEFAKTAQRLAGVPVTTVTREDSAEAVYKTAEDLWMDAKDPKAALAAYERILSWRGTQAWKKSLYAQAWIQHNLILDTAAARKAYQTVVDTLPGTVWAKAAQAALDGPKDFTIGITTRRDPLDFEEGDEREDTTKTRLGPRKPPPTQLDNPNEPEPIPPRPEDLLSPDDFN
ncbi:MAG TPA: hypothetical protein PKO15_00685 [Fibrobacteria bacterium]|nr:hypothetical protein [Fibrobacteria bacterium]HOX50333.1 hypothetical protein [Fibrobacteria bacterium]